MAVQDISPYTPVGEDVVERFLDKPYNKAGYDGSIGRYIRGYSYLYDNGDYNGNQHWPAYNNYPVYHTGGYIWYKVDPDTGDVTFTCDGKHTKPFQFDFINSYTGAWELRYGALQDAHYHLSGCPAGGSKDTYFMYLGPYNQRRGNAISTDMGLYTNPIDTGNGVDIDLRTNRYFKTVEVGNKLIDGSRLDSNVYTVTETGLHTGFYTNYGPVLSFVIMPGVKLDNLVVKRPKLVKTDEAYYKGEDVMGRPLGFAQIETYSKYEAYGLHIFYDWDNDGYRIQGRYQMESEYGWDEIRIRICYNTLLTAGHKYKLIPPKEIKNDPSMNWRFGLYCPIEEMDPSLISQDYPLGNGRPELSLSYGPERHVWTTGILEIASYQPIKDEYIFTLKKDKYEGAYYENNVTQGTNDLGFRPSLKYSNGDYVDIFISTPKLISLSGPEKNPQPGPEPPPYRPEPSKPAEPDIIWNLGTSFVISPDNYETGLLDNYESLIWNEVYNDIGDFEVDTIVNDEILKICRPGNMITRNDSDKIMIIESIKITTDVETGNHITVKGRSFESVLDRRIIWDQTTVSGSVHNAIKKLITDAMIEPKNECRKIDNFIFEDSKDQAVLQYQMDEAQFEGESLLESVKKICDIFHLGFKVYLNEKGEYAFKLYTGTDRSYYQEDLPYVIFSHNFGNLLDSEFITDSYNYKNTMLVISDNEDMDTKRVVIGDNYSGMDRREISYKSSISPNKEGGGKYTNIEFARMLTEDGTRELTNYKMVNQFQGSADVHQMYVYGEDFFLGDIIQVVDEFGNSSCSRVTSLVISHDSNGIYSYPKFEVFERGDKIKITTADPSPSMPKIAIKYNDSLTTVREAWEFNNKFVNIHDLIEIGFYATEDLPGWTVKSLKRVIFGGKIQDAGVVLANYGASAIIDLEVNEYIDEEVDY